MTRLRILEPLRRRDFALLTLGSTVSLLGDGFFYVALAWQVYEISNVPTALSVVGVAWTLPLVCFLLPGGLIGDRADRRLVMIGADLLRAVALGAIGVLALSGRLELWHLLVLIAFAGAGDAFFYPSATAIVPDLVSADELPQANALQGISRPLAARLLGPALGGLLVGTAGPGSAFLIDAATFLVSAATIALIAGGSAKRSSGRGLRRALGEVGEGLRFVRANAWCWATLAAATVSLLAYGGPMEVLLPYLVKNELRVGAEGLGLIFAIGGIGAILTSIAVGQTGLPRRFVTVMYLAWAFGSLGLGIYGLMTALWQAFVASFLTHALFTLSQIIWTTMLQRLVPGELLGRVSSLDWLVSAGLVPVSFALTGPASAAFGPATTLIGAALIGWALPLLFLTVPGVRGPEAERAGL